MQRSQGGTIRNLAKKKTYVNHYSFHIIDPLWGHVTIKMSGHPPFGAQVILNGHEHVAAMASSAGVGFGKEGNCFTEISDPAGLAQLADTLSQPAAIGRLGQVCDRWIYSACLCFGLDLVRAGTVPVRLRLLRLPGRVQPQPALRVRGSRWTGSSTPWWTAPAPVSTSPSCAPCSAPNNAPAPTAPTCHPGWQP